MYAIDLQSGEKRWAFTTGGAVNSTAAVADGIVYFASTDGKIYALDAQIAELQWEFKTGAERAHDGWDYVLSTPTLDDKTVYIGSGDGHVYALNRQSGAEQWRFQTGGIVHASPALHNGTVYIGSFDGYFYALDAASGAMQWKFKTVGDSWFPLGEVQGSALVANDVVYFGSRDYNIYALDAEKGTGRWNYKVPGSWVISKPIIHNSTIFFGSSDAFRIYAMDAETGAIKWEFPVGLNIFGEAAFAEDVLYFGSFDGHVYALKSENGEEIGNYQTETSRVNTAAIFDENGQVRQELFDGRESLQDWENLYRDEYFRLGSIIGSVVAHDGLLYFGSVDGKLYAVKHDR